MNNPADVIFDQVVNLIHSARQKAFHAVNTTLIELYWQVGAYISRKIENAEWGDGRGDGLRGFTPRNLFRMRQFYETYRYEGKLSPLVSQ